MSLKKIYSLSEAEASDGVPEPVPERPRPNLSRLFQGTKPPAGQGSLSNGIPQAFRGPEGPKAPRQAPPGSSPAPQDTARVSYTDKTAPMDEPAAQDVTIPNPKTRANVGGTGQPPKGGVPFSRPPNAPPEEPLPDLPLEGRLGRMFGIAQKVEFMVPRRAGKLVELYNIDEMPRPAGSYGGPTMAMLKWAKDQGGRELSARDMFKVWRQAGGQPNQGDDNKAYASFQTTLRQFIDPRGRGTPEQPLIVVQAGKRGRGGAAIYRWGAVRPSQSAAAGPQPGATAFDNMELGPAGQAQTLARQPQPPAADDQEMPEMEPNPEGEPEEPEIEDEPAEDEFDWIPETGDPDDSGIPGAMGRLKEERPEELEELLAAVYGATDTDDAGMKAIQIFGRGKARTRDAILVAKQCALNLGRPNKDED